MKIGYTHGRFQPFHKGHLSVMMYILENYDELWVGIANPLRRFPEYFNFFEKDLKDSLLKARDPNKNIFSFMQRREMILKSLENCKVDLNRVKIFPHFAFYEEENWEDFMPDKDLTTIVIHVKDVHHERKIEEYEELGWSVDRLPYFDIGVSGTKFFKEYPKGNWKELVPKGTIEVIENIKQVL